MRLSAHTLRILAQENDDLWASRLASMAGRGYEIRSIKGKLFVS